MVDDRYIRRRLSAMNDIFIMRRDVVINGVIYRSSYVENIYVSETGDAIRVNYYEDNRTIKDIFRPKQEHCNGGYRRIGYIKTSKTDKRHLLIHRLVYSAWGSEPLSPYLVIDHIDANPSNNNISNLRQVTQKENIRNAVLHGNFGRSAMKKVRVYDTITNTFKDYNSVRDFLVDIEAPDYMVRHNSLSTIRKRREYDRYQYIVIQES